MPALPDIAVFSSMSASVVSLARHGVEHRLEFVGHLLRADKRHHVRGEEVVLRVLEHHEIVLPGWHGDVLKMSAAVTVSVDQRLDGRRPTAVTDRDEVGRRDVQSVLRLQPRQALSAVQELRRRTEFHLGGMRGEVRDAS